MISDNAIKDALLAFAEANKTNTIILSVLMNEIGAIRETLKQVNGKQFAERLQQMQLDLMAKNMTIETANLRLCDELIERVKAL